MNWLHFVVYRRLRTVHDLYQVAKTFLRRKEKQLAKFDRQLTSSSLPRPNPDKTRLGTNQELPLVSLRNNPVERETKRMVRSVKTPDRQRGRFHARESFTPSHFAWRSLNACLYRWFFFRRPFVRFLPAIFTVIFLVLMMQGQIATSNQLQLQYHLVDCNTVW